MFFSTLEIVFSRMKELGLTKSQRHFSRHWLGRQASYMNDFVAKDRRDRCVPAHVADELCRRLDSVGRWTPSAVRPELQKVVQLVERGCHIAARLKR